MKRTKIFLLLLLTSIVSCYELGIDNDTFEDLDGGDRDVKSFFNDNDPGTDDSVFVSETSNKLQDGREMITRDSEVWTTDPETGKSIQKKVSKHFIKYPNGTVLQVTEQEGSGEHEESENHATAVECISEDDCNGDDFCDRLSFSCKSCCKANETCHRQRECCEGHICRDGKCDAITGKDGDPCASDRDCKQNHCCAYQEGKDVCRPYLEEGETCADGGLLSPRFPSFFTRKFMQNARRSFCPCLKGLECKKQDSYFLMQPKTCTSVTKKMKPKKWRRERKHIKKTRKERREETEQEKQERREDIENEKEERREEMEHEDQIDQGDEDDHEDDHDDEDDDDEGHEHDDDDDEHEDIEEAIMDKLPRLLHGIFRRFLE